MMDELFETVKNKRWETVENKLADNDKYYVHKMNNGRVMFICGRTKQKDCKVIRFEAPKTKRKMDRTGKFEEIYDFTKQKWTLISQDEFRKEARVDIRDDFDTLADFAVKNGYTYTTDAKFIYIKTINDRYKVKINQLERNAKEYDLWHENLQMGRARHGWHKQGNHPWGLASMQRLMFSHDYKLDVGRGKGTQIIPSKDRVMVYGLERGNKK